MYRGTGRGTRGGRARGTRGGRGGHTSRDNFDYDYIDTSYPDRTTDADRGGRGRGGRGRGRGRGRGDHDAGADGGFNGSYRGSSQPRGGGGGIAKRALGQLQGIAGMTRPNARGRGGRGGVEYNEFVGFHEGRGNFRAGRGSRNSAAAQGQFYDGPVVIFIKASVEGVIDSQTLIGDDYLQQFLCNRAGISDVNFSSERVDAKNEGVSFMVDSFEHAKAIRALSGIRYQRVKKLIITTSQDKIILGDRHSQHDRTVAIARLPQSSGTINAIRRYIQEQHKDGFLNLQSMAQSEILRSANIISPGQKAGHSDVAAVIMKVAAEMFPEIHTISFASNALRSVRPIEALSEYFPYLLNLSLRCNEIANSKDLEGLSGNRLPNLKELVLLDNPIRERDVSKNNDDISYRSEIAKLFPSIQMLDLAPVSRIMFGLDATKSVSPGALLKLPVRGNFFDKPETEATVVGFLTSYFSLFDSERALLEHIYDVNATFSYSAITQPSPLQRSQGILSENWSEYLRQSRNLSRLSDLGARTTRLHVGSKDIVYQGLMQLPETRHDLSENSKVCVDAWETGGLLPTVCIYISVHGEFEEVRRGAQESARKSFDRTFIIAPAPPGSVASVNGYPCLIISDQLTLRGYNGSSGWKPDLNMNVTPSLAAAATGVATALKSVPIATAVPPIFSGSLASVTSTHMDALPPEQQTLVHELQRVTGLNAETALQCLLASGWNATKNDSNLLVIVIDTNPFEWEHPSAPLKLNQALQHILAFMNAHLAGRHDNKLAVIASHVGVSKFLYPTLNELTPGSKVQTKKDANVYQVFKVVNDAVISGISRLLQDPGPTLQEKDLGSSKIAASLSLGLCYINQAVRSDGMGHVKARILVLTVSPDSSSDYIPIMNCIFSAQKANIPIDVCKIWGEDAVFLQQAAHITEGIYMRPDDPQGLLQILMFSFLPDMFSRNYLYLPGQDQVDFRAAFLQLFTSVLNVQIFCIDLDLSMDEHFSSGEKNNDTRINRTKQLLKWFIEQKSQWNKQHEYAIMILGERAVWHMDFTTDKDLLSHVIDELYTMGKFTAFDSTSLFEEIRKNANVDDNDESAIHAIVLYTRSDVVPTLPDYEAMDALYSSGRFHFDCIFIHNKAVEVTGPVKPQHVYDRLTEMEDARAPGYFYETTRYLRKYTSSMGELLINPAVRPLQDEVSFKMTPPPSVQRQLDEDALQELQQQHLSTPRRTDIPVTYKSSEFSTPSPVKKPAGGLFAASPAQAPTVARTPPPAGSSPFASPMRENSVSSSRDKSEQQHTGLGIATGNVAAGSGSGKGMDDAILL
ncbi:nuclear mRNA export, poly(A)+RNA binding protein [Mortierella alpina]|nr:nuclear mRNA export, poly(A)+RNA binding protein [Mortierella alpina]